MTTGVRITVDGGEFYVASKTGSRHEYKPDSLHHDARRALERAGELLGVQGDSRLEQAEKQRDELLAALEGVLAWDKERQFPIPYRVRDPIHAAIASVKGGAA